MSVNSNDQIYFKYAEPVFVSSSKNDTNSPFSFKDWYQSHQNIIPNQEFRQYNEYLVRWYKNKSLTVVDQNLQLKLNYLTLLKQLQLFFSVEEAENWYNKVNVENEKELLLAIPYFAKKLKDISLYYLQVRKNIKESRLKYNRVGTNVGVIQQIEKILLENFSKKENRGITLPGYIWNNVPELSALNEDLVIQLEELYDFHEYFDLSPTVPISSYFDVDSNEILNFLQTKNLFLTSADWVYKSGVFPLSSNSYDDLEIGKILAEKYLGEDKFISIPITNTNTNTEVFDVPISQGNNTFLWPGDVYDSKALTHPRYTPVALSSLGLETLATAGTGIEIADTIFIKTVNGTKGAWLRNELIDFKEEAMNATINSSSKTTFRFPFPGYGLSAEDSGWTGFSTQSDRRYKFLDDETKQGIENLYWSEIISLSSIKTLPLKESSLIQNKAYAHTNYNHSDRIKVWGFSPEYNTSVVSDLIDESWLYRFNKTDISIAAGQDNIVVWPYEKINKQLDFPLYYPDNMSDVCASVNVSSLDLPFAVAGQNLSSADVIYKINNFKDIPENAIECCWLSGKQIEYASQKITLTDQSTLQLLMSAGIFTKFVWLGNDLTDANLVFKNIQHQPDCSYKNTKYANYLNHSMCDCGAVKFSPFGHPGEKYEQNTALTDFIIEDTFSPGSLNLNSWKDIYGTSFNTSSAFGWFKTNQSIGWGEGNWVTNNTNTGNKLYLQNGRKYVYYRANVKQQNTEDTNLPEYVLKYKYDKPNTGVWIQAQKKPDGTWITEDVPSSMIIHPGDLLLYSRANSINYELSGTQSEKIDVYENRGSIWSNVDYLTIDTNRYVAVSYPSISYLSTSNTTQYPRVGISNIIRFSGWTVTTPDQNRFHFKNQSAISFVPSLTGLYNISVTAISAEPSSLTNFGAYTISGIYVFNNIPAVTAIPTTIDVPSLTSYDISVPGCVINTPLYGWDYNTSTFNSVTKKENQGGKPFWAKVYDQKNKFTGYKGIASIGNSVRLQDEHNLITQPEFTDITLNMGVKVEYFRKYPTKINWIQPLNFEVLIDENYWCDLLFDENKESNLSHLLYNDSKELVITPTTTRSNLTITNIVDNAPVEINYNALNSFNWSISVVPQISETLYNSVSAQLQIKADSPWTNLANLNYPTIATIPSLDDLYSSRETGGYFIPNNLGVTTYIDQNYETSLMLSAEALNNYFEDNSKKYKIRGLTKEPSNTPYKLDSQNNTWFKESVIGNASAGTIKKNIFKKYQKFLPYQSEYESNPRKKVGLITPDSRQSPWGGKENAEWDDRANHPISFTGELNLDKWADKQILKRIELQVDNWVTDIFGNQYGLYKDTKDVYPSDKTYYPGEIWTRKNSQTVAPANEGLKNVFDTYANLSIVNELTGFGVLRIDMFFDTLMIETTGAVIFEKINYDYENDNIFSLADESRYISLAMPVSSNFDREFNKVDLENYSFGLAGDTWFFPEEKQVTVSVCSLLNGNIFPELYNLDLNTLVLEKVFPLLEEDITTIRNLSAEGIAYHDPPVLSYNSLKEEYVLSLLCEDQNVKDLILEFNIKNDYRPKLKDLVIYKSKPESLIFNPPVIHHALQIDLLIGNNLNFQCLVENGPGTFTVLNKPSWVELTTSGLLRGTPTEAGTYYINFTVSNHIGPTYYNFTINVTAPVIIPETYYLYTEGYMDISDQDDGYVLQLEETETEEYKIILVDPSPVYYLNTEGYFNIPGDEDGLILLAEDDSDPDLEKIVLIT